MDNEIVIARYGEDVEWISAIPADFKVIVYNKGSPIASPRALERADAIIALANSGRESDTFLRHVLGKTSFGGGFTVFLQGDPLEHSPDILTLLAAWRRWRDLQPLSWQWLAHKRLPPPDILTRETGGFLDTARVRPELFSLARWEPVQFHDPGARRVADLYRHLHDLPEGVNIAADFLSRCELTGLAQQAEDHLVGRFAYGALFAVRQDVLQRLSRQSLEHALEAANANPVYGYILERLWLHLCGEPFILPVTAAAADRDARNGPRFVAPAPRQPLHLRIVPGLKRRISHWAQDA